MRAICVVASCAPRLRLYAMRALRCSSAPSIWPTWTPNLSPNLSGTSFRLLVREGDAGYEDVHLTDLESEHALGRLDDVALDRGRDVGQLGFRVDGDEDIQVDRAIGLDLHAHTSMGGLAANPVAEMTCRSLVHS